MSDESFRFTPEAPAREAVENVLLRASLAEAQARIEALERSAETDPQTGLATERRFRRELERVVGQAERHGTQAALLYFDLRGLDSLNAAHGRFAGDAAIVHVAKLLSKLIRGTDHLARLEGGRFGLILDHLDHDSAIDTAERLGRCIAADPVDLGPAGLSIRAAVAATSILPGDKVEDVLQRSERNLELAKSEG
jgi:diguanylate cyclase (GGDEF)-like protein